MFKLLHIPVVRISTNFFIAGISLAIRTMLISLCFTFVPLPSEASDMNELIKITFDPPEFDVRDSMPKEGEPTPYDLPLPQFSIDCASPIVPSIPGFEAFNENNEIIPSMAIRTNLPTKVSVDVPHEALKSFSWKQIPIPVIISAVFVPSMKEKGLSMNFLDKSGRYEVKRVAVYPAAWHGSFPPRVEVEPWNSMYYMDNIPDEMGESEYWGMTYFTDLPKYSVTYDFWLTARGADSEKKTFTIEFYVDGIKVTPENFEKMAHKYPELKENTWK